MYLFQKSIYKFIFNCLFLNLSNQITDMVGAMIFNKFVSKQQIRN